MLDLLLQTMCYRKIGDNRWIKTIGYQLISIEIQDNYLSMRSWFMPANQEDTKLHCYKSVTEFIDQERCKDISIRWIQDLEAEVAQDPSRFGKGKTELLVPQLSIEEIYKYEY